jgi:hypothetical protein
MLTDAPDVHPRLVEIVDVLKDLKADLINYKIKVMRIESQLQKRDPKTGKYIKR